MKAWSLLLCAPLLLVSLAPAPAAASPGVVCTYDIIESIAVCAGIDEHGRVCVTVFVGPSTPVDRCFDPAIIDPSPCAAFATIPLTVCVSVSKEEACAYGSFDGRPFRRCVDLRLTTAASAARCTPWVPPGGADMGERVCVDPNARCQVWHERLTFIGTQRTCLVPPGGEGGSAAMGGGPNCFDRYWETEVGPVRVVSRNSCHYEVWVLGERVGLE